MLQVLLPFDRCSVTPTEVELRARSMRCALTMAWPGGFTAYKFLVGYSTSLASLPVVVILMRCGVGWILNGTP